MSKHKHIIDFKFPFGEIVYLIHDPDQLERMVVSYKVQPLGVLYGLAVGEIETYHYDFEISTEKNMYLLYNMN